MQKEFLEKKEFEVNVNRTVCDVCGEVVKDNQVRVRLGVVREHNGNPYGPGVGASRSIDVCSPTCLRDNANGINLLLQTKIIPSLDDKEEGEKMMKSSSGFVGYSTASPAFSVSVNSFGEEAKKEEAAPEKKSGFSLKEFFKKLTS